MTADYGAVASFGQRQLWVVDHLLPNKTVYNEPWVDRLTGPLDVGALERALSEIVNRHDVLRTRFAVIDGVLTQVVAPASPHALPVEDLAGLAMDEREAQARRRAEDESARPFDLQRGPLFRARLLRLGPQEHWLLMMTHHIVFDRWSAAVLARELSALYRAFSRGLPSPLPELPVQYADYAEWQHEWLAGERLDRLLAYWKSALAELPTLDLPTDRRRLPVPTFQGGQIEFEIGDELAGALRELSRREDATLFMTLLAAFQVLLYRWSGRTDVAIGVPIAGRNRPELEELIGFFVNIVVMRGDLSGEPAFSTLLGRVRRVALDAYAHASLPFEKLVEHLAPRRDLSRNPLFQVSFRLGNTPPLGLQLPGLVVEHIGRGNRDAAKVDLAFAASEDAGRLTMRVEYAADLFDAATIERLAEGYRTLLGAIVAAPGQRIDRLPLRSPARRERLLARWNPTAVDYPRERCIHEVFEQRVERHPDALAVIFENRQLTYGELNARANRLAHHLRGLGVGPETRVALCMERSFEVVVALLAILKAGGAYVPLDPDSPAPRIAFMLADAQATVLLTQRHLLGRLPECSCSTISVDADWPAIAMQPDTNPARTACATSLAYVIYTSGTTGRPKGVLVEHRSVCNHLVAQPEPLRPDATDCMLQTAAVAFDPSVLQIFIPLMVGARLVLPAPGEHRSPAAIVDLIRRHGVTLLRLVPALLSALVDGPGLGRCERLRRVFCGGEPLTGELAARFFAQSRAELVQVYGPTETTVHSIYFLCRRDDLAQSIPIGRPIANTSAYVLDAHDEPVPIGAAGDLCIGGDGVARGYLGQPELTALRFVPDPFARHAGARMYKTGDRARVRPDGAIEFLGRLDSQVKIRGHRVELEEVEAALVRLPHVLDAAVVARGDTTETRQLVAYVVAAESAGAPPANLWRDLKPLLPEYMLPASIVWLKSLPRNANGKVDRGALPAAPARNAPPAGEHVAPRDMFEAALAGIWERLLGVDRIGVHDHFFERGGHSLLAAQLFDAIERETGLAAPLAVLFADDTIAGLARVLRERPAGPAAPIVTLNDGGAQPPLVFLHGDLTGGGFYTRSIAQALGPDQPLLVVHPHTLDNGAIPETIEAMAADRIRALRALRPRGPYLLAGYCNGAHVAFEMARQLVGEGESVPLVIAIEARAPRGATIGGAGEGYVVLDRSGGYRVLAPNDRASETQLRYARAMGSYAGGPYGGSLALVRSRSLDGETRDLGWARFAARVEIHRLPGDHSTVVTRHVGDVARVIRGAIGRVGAPAVS
jgi:amino acid adenylation domain-containing protein